MLSGHLSFRVTSMSLMQRIEQGFYSLTRLLSIILTLALLACALVIAKSWLDATAPEAKPGIPTVTAEDVLAHVTVDDKGGTADDANHEAYERMKKAIVSFASKHQVSADNLDPDTIIDDVKETANDQENKLVTAAYANGAAAMLEGALADPRIDGLVKKAEDAVEADAKPSSADERLCADVKAINLTLEDLLADYRVQFLKKAVPSESSDQDRLTKREDTMLGIARIGGPLFLLLIILQVLAFGRVDQSLRDIAHRQGG